MSDYGTEFIEWDPITIGLTLKDRFGEVPPRYLMDRIQAGSAIMTSDLYFKSLETFNNINDVLNLGLMDAGTFIPATLDDILWGVTESKLMLGDMFTGDFSHDIAGFTGYLLGREGIYTPPSTLSFAEYAQEDAVDDQQDLFGDDVLYKEFWNRQHDTRKQLEVDAQKKLRELFRQLKELPVKDIDKDFVDSFLQRIDTNITENESPASA